MQSVDKFTEVGELDMKSGIFQALEKIEPVKLQGTYSFVGEDLVALFCFNGRVFVKVGTEIVQITEDTSAVIEAAENENIFRILEGGSQVLAYTYIPQKGIDGDMTPFVDSEDDDFCLFVANIINSPARQGVLIEVSQP